MKTFKYLITGCSLVAACALLLVLPPVPVQAGDWGISLNVPFVRVRAQDGYYYRDNDFNNRYDYQSHVYAPEQRYYYYPSHSRRHHSSDRYNNWVGVDGRTYRDHYRR